MKQILCAIRMILTVIFLFPLFLILLLLASMIKLINHMYDGICGLIFIFLGIMFLLALIYQMWMQLAVLGFLFGFLLLIGYAGQGIYLLLEIFKMTLWEYIF